MKNDFMIVTRHPTPKELLENLGQIAPEFLSAWNNEDNLFIDKDGSFSVHGVFTKFSSFIYDNFDLLDENRRKKLFDYVEECVNTDIHSEYGVSNAACTCFLEDLAAEGVLSNTISKYLGVDRAYSARQVNSNVMAREEGIMIGFGDNVRVRKTPLTEQMGIAGVTGNVYGETTPSVTGVDVIGELTDDFALNVQPEKGEGFWIVPSLLEFIDHAPGTEIVVGNVRAVREEDGSWKESQITPKKPWWKIW